MTCLAIAAAGCGGTGSDADPDAAVPQSRGEVWEIDSAHSRRFAPAVLLAFVSGTHVLVVDGDATYAGMQVTHGGKAPDGGQPLALAGSIEATLAPAGDAMQVRFASGETVVLRRRTTPERR